jgi:hypothetical protein
LSNGATNPFQPVATVAQASGTVSTSIKLAGGGDSVLITNAAPSLAYVRFGSDPTVQATTGDTPVLPNSQILFGCGHFVSYCATVLGSGTGMVMFTRGNGSSI